VYTIVFLKTSICIRTKLSKLVLNIRIHGCSYICICEPSWKRPKLQGNEQRNEEYGSRWTWNEHRKRGT